VLVGGPKASIVAFDTLTGQVRWQSGQDGATYASPIITEHRDRPLAVFLTHDGVTALNPETGARYWQYPLVDKLSESSTTPVRTGDLLFASSVTFGSVGLRLTTKDGRPACEEVWKNPALTCYFSTPVAVGEQLYVVTGRIVPPSARLHCVDAKTGKVLWTRPNVGTYHATVMRAGDRLLMLEEKGELVLIQPDPKEYRELARAKVCGQTWAHPALSDGRLYVRDGKELLCVRLSEKP
jgi:glucose dehydrogenase